MPQTLATLNDAETRRQYSAPAFRGFAGVATDWNLTDAQQLLLLGESISRPTLHEWKKKGFSTALTIDQLTRISLLLGIYEGLQRFFRRAPEEAERWLRRPRAERPFDGRTPLDVMLERGIPGLGDVRQYIDSAAGGPPSRSWQYLGMAAER